MKGSDVVGRLVVIGVFLPTFVWYLLLVTSENQSDTSQRYQDQTFGELASHSPPTDGSCSSCDNGFDLVMSGSDGTVEDPDEAWWDWNEVQRSRRTALGRACRHLGRVGKPLTRLFNNRGLLYNLLVDDRHKAIYCYVPKVACTNWKRMLMILSGRTNETNPLKIRSNIPHGEGILHRLSTGNMRLSILNYKLRTYTKFLFVRHPMERLVSAYRNKLVKNSTSAKDFKKKYGISIMKKYRKGSSAHNISKTGHGVTFTEFASYLIEQHDSKIRNLNEHWAPYVDLCHPCSIKYNIIGKYETLEEDAEYTLRKIGAPRGLHFPPFVASHTASLVPGYMATLPTDISQKLHKLYEPDFKLFEYGYP